MTGTHRKSQGTLEPGYWDRMAPRYDDEIFNSLQHDRSRVILDEIRKSRRRASRVADFGCGIGIYLPVLSRIFDEVHGFDSSRECVRIAGTKVRGMANVSVQLASFALRRGRARFGSVICVNVLLDPSARARRSILRRVCGLLAPLGRLILVVPSLESATLLAAAEREESRHRSRPAPPYWDVSRHTGGVVAIEGVPTKHYTRSELAALVSGLGLQLVRIRRVEYSWSSHSLAATRRLRGERPWDWIAVANSEN